jgi:hypothetical protein
MKEDRGAVRAPVAPARIIVLHVSSLRHFSQVSEPPRRPPATVRRATGAPPPPNPQPYISWLIQILFLARHTRLDCTF